MRIVGLKSVISFGGSKSGNPCERLTAQYLLDMRVIRRITESVKPDVRVDSGFIRIGIRLIHLIQ